MPSDPAAAGTPAIASGALADLSPLVLYELLKIRSDVFVVEQNCAYPDLDGRDTEPGAVHFWAEVDGEVAACLRRLREPDGSVRIGRIATRSDQRGRGLAAALIDAALAGVGTGVLLDAQEQLEGWYERLGFERVGTTFVEDGIAHVPMRRA